MEDTLRRMRNRHADDRGFTLIELLVVVVIIGVLVAIAVPMYLNYRKGAANKSAESDLRSAISAVEQFYTENGNQYPKATNNDATPGTKIEFDKKADGSDADVKQTATVSPGNTLGLAVHKTNAAAYVLCSYSSDGGNVYIYDSTVGGSVQKSDQDTLTNCLTNQT